MNATFTELTDSMRRLGSGGHVLHELARETELERPPVEQQIDDEPTAKALVN